MIPHLVYYQLVILVLVLCHFEIVGYSLHSFTRASSVVNCQWALGCLSFRSRFHACTFLIVRDHRVATHSRRRSWCLASLAPLAFCPGSGFLSPV